ncbi:hypothetical protein HanLR1_Chr11g0415531 [Helianthus annuus]|nr:hypothetical protein HanHA89_Chr11g0437831 [Helianthus annuus]KAJ0686506.1 hypothetical protein HanLR1_Chr11g0415531 [Helianthus annuus]
MRFFCFCEHESLLRKPHVGSHQYSAKRCEVAFKGLRQESGDEWKLDSNLSPMLEGIRCLPVRHHLKIYNFLDVVLRKNSVVRFGSYINN